MRVAMFTECYRPIQNGVVASLDSLSETLRERGHEVVLVTPEMPGHRESTRELVRVPSLPLPSRTEYRLTIPLMLHQRLERALENVAIVHAHSPFVTGWMGMRYARRARVPLVFSYHTQYDRYVHYVPFEARATRYATLEITQRFANAADAVIVPNAAMEAHVRGLGVSSRFAVVPSGIDVERFAAGRPAPRWREGVAPNERLLLWVGRLAREKNLELLLDALARPEAGAGRLLVVGDGPERGQLERHAGRLGLATRVRFAGEVPRKDLAEVYASADLFVMTSLTETQGLVLVEALAAGLPIVAVDTPQTRDVLDGAGRLVPPEPAALAAALGAELPRAIRDPAAGRVRAARFERTALGGSVLELYDSLLAVRA